MLSRRPKACQRQRRTARHRDDGHQHSLFIAKILTRGDFAVKAETLHKNDNTFEQDFPFPRGALWGA